MAKEACEYSSVAAYIYTLSVQDNTHIHRERDRETERPTDRETERPTDRETDRHTDRETERPTDRETDRQRDAQTDRQRDRQTERRTYQSNGGVATTLAPSLTSACRVCPSAPAVCKPRTHSVVREHIP